MSRPKRKPAGKPKRDYSSELHIFVPVALFFLIVVGVGIWAAHRARSEKHLQPVRVAGVPWLIEHEAFAGAKKQFEHRHPEFVIEAAQAEGPALVEKASGEKPDADLIIGLTGQQVAQLAGSIASWDDFFDTRTARTDFIRSFCDDATVAKRLLMMPVMGDGVFLLVRPRWLKEANVAAPFETWTQLAVAAAKLTRGEGEPKSRYGLAVEWGEGSAGLIYASALKARGVSADPPTKSLKAPETREAVSFWSDLVSGGLCSKEVLSDPQAARRAFVQGRAAVAWTMASVRREAIARLGTDEVACLPLPGSERHGTAVVTYGAVIPTPSKHQALAQRFVREHLLAEPFQRAVAESTMYLPSLRRNYKGLKGGQWQTILRVVQRGHGMKPADFDRLDRVLAQDLTPAITGSQQPKDALAQAAEDLASAQRTPP